MVKAALLGQDVGWIGAWTGRSEQTVRLWLDRYERGGVGALADAPRCGRPATADAAYLAALERAAETPPPALGLAFDVWTTGLWEPKTSAAPSESLAGDHDGRCSSTYSCSPACSGRPPAPTAIWAPRTRSCATSSPS